MQQDFRYDALSGFDRNQSVDRYTLSIKRAAKSERDRFSKQRPQYVT